MFLQISISKKDRPFFRFLWRDMDTSITPKTFEFNKVVFGITCSPFLAHFVSQYNAKKYKNDYKLAADTVMNSCYMDDCIDSVKTEKEGIQLYQELSKLWEKANMVATKWVSNSSAVIKNIPKEKLASEIELGKELPIKKTLGIMWDSHNDIFKFKAKSPQKNWNQTRISKICSINL